MRSGHELVVVLVSRDRLVLGAVVLEDAMDVLGPADQPEIADEQPDPEQPLRQVHQHAVKVEPVL